MVSIDHEAAAPQPSAAAIVISLVAFAPGRRPALFTISTASRADRLRARLPERRRRRTALPAS
jgi:hypothetical protein